MVKTRFRIEWYLLPLILLAFWLGLRMLNADIFWHDEIRSIYYSSDNGQSARPLTETLSLLTEHNWQSPLYFLLLNRWGSLVGFSEFAGRFLSLFIGILGLAFAYRMASRMFSRRVGLFTATILTGTSQFTHYLHDMRPYTLYLLLTCITVWAYWEIIEKRKHTVWVYTALFIGLVGLGYTHALALLTSVGMGLYHLILAKKDRVWLQTSAVMILAAICVVPWVFVSLGIFNNPEAISPRAERSLYGFQIVQYLFYAFSNGSVLFGLLLISISLISIRRGTIFALLWLISAMITAMLLSYPLQSLTSVRYFMAVIPALCLLTGISVYHLWQRGVPPILPLGLWLGLGIYTGLSTEFFERLPSAVISLPREGYMAIADVINDSADPDDLVVFHTTELWEEWQAPEVNDYYLDHPNTSVLALELLQPYAVEVDEALYMQVTEDVVNSEPVVWTGVINRVPQSFRQHAFFKQLDSSHTHCENLVSTDEATLDLYALMPDEMDYTFGDSAVQIGLIHPLPQVVQGNLDVFLALSRDNTLSPDTYSVALHLLNESGQLVAQTDYGLSNESHSCQLSTLVSADLPDGDYQLMLLIYAWQTGDRLLADNGSDAIELGTISIEQN